MKILHTSDWHVGRTIRGRSRAGEHRDVLAEIARIAGEEAADLVLVAGDVFDAAAPTAESERIVYRALLDLAEAAPVVIVAGNHDDPRRLAAVAPLLELGRVRVASFVTRPDDGGVIHGVGGPVRLALLPWQNQRGIVSAADLMDKEASDQEADFEGRMRRVVAGLCAGMSPDTINVVVGHLTVHGALDSGSERSAQLFRYGVGTRTFPGELSYVALGHFHRQQRIAAAAPLWYSGSPLQLDFGEAGQDKGVLLVEAEPGLPAQVRSVPLESGRRLVRLSGTLDQVSAAAADLGDAFVKVEIDEPARAGLADEVREAVPAAVDVVLAAAAMHAPRRAAARRIGRDPLALFSEYLESVGVDDPRLASLFEDLLDEVHDG
jgi:exonuclease SbcD